MQTRSPMWLAGEIVAEDGAPALTWSPVATEDEILRALEKPPHAGERIEYAFRRKEVELRILFAELSVSDARELHRRLSRSLPADRIAARFARLITERRERLLSFLADVRRREAIRCA